MKYSARLRSAAVLLAACMTVGLAACGGREESLPSSDGTPLSSDTGGPVSEDGLDNSGKETASTMTSQTTIAAPESSAPVGSETKSSLESAARLLGRTFYDEETEAVYFSHTGSGFELTFTGKQLQAELVADIGSLRSPQNRPFLAIYVDDMDTPAQTYEMDNVKRTITLFSSPEPRTVKIRVLKRSEAQSSSIGVQRLVAEEGAVLAPTPEASRRMLFIGDSYTCGYGNEGTLNDEFRTKTENGCDTYAARTARRFGADMQCLCWSGIGVYSSYTEKYDKPNNGFLMKDFYPYTDWSGMNRLGLEPERYDPARFRPDVVVIHLGTNDASYTAKIGEEARDAFAKAYDDLLTMVRSDYPEARILCVLGPAGEETRRLFSRIETLAENRRAAGDGRISTLLFPETQDGEGLGTGWHPSMKTHIRMAGELTAKIEEFLGWSVQP